MRFFASAALFAILTGVALTVILVIGASRFTAYEDVEPAVLFEAVKQVTYATIGEKPRFSPSPLTGPVPICRDVPSQLVKPLKLGFRLMRGTSEGRRLFEMLVDSDVCVTVDDLKFNAAYAFSRETTPDDWSTSQIVIDRSLVRSTATDALAAILVHEATHIDRAVSGQACFVNGRCERLPNGVEIDEEIAAHAAEAAWWIEAFGVDGKRFAFRGDYGENRLAGAYLKGEDWFRAYVTAYRSDPREGDGIEAYNPARRGHE